MNTGLSLSEMLVILTLALVFFGSKELPAFIREIARFLAKARRYSEKLRKEIDGVSSSLEPSVNSITPVRDKKKQLREHYLTIRKNMEQSVHSQKSDIIYRNLTSLQQFKDAGAVMIYVDFKGEVATRKAIADMLSCGKRVVVPYCKAGSRDLGLAEIKDPENDLVPGEFNILEPHPSLRKQFFKSDLQLVICPGVAFDVYGGRLGRGKAYYDNFLREIKGKIPIYSFAFDFQISKEPLPFDYHDISMDQIITESGIQIPQNSETKAVENSPAG